MMTKSHNYSLLNFSPWPLICSLNSFNFMFSIMMFLKLHHSASFLISIMGIIYCSFMWWIYYSGEFNLEGMASFNLDNGLKFSMLLFISSEVFFFFSFFWSYFHFFLAPTLDLGLIWPPMNIQTFDFLNVPLINTLLLLTSGVTITISHNYLNSAKYNSSSKYLMVTIMLGLIFTILQGMEYKSSFFSISDSTFGTTFFMLTGFHGIHVAIGTIFLLTTFYRFHKNISSKKESLSFELASWYWHFVDVVWIFLYTILYYMNN